MAFSRPRRRFAPAGLVLSLAISVAACSGSGSTSSTNDDRLDGGQTGGSTGSGGTAGPDSGAGSTAMAGASGSGGMSLVGGASAVGGTSAAAGTTATGTGGTTTLGGTPGTGGQSSTGGTTGGHTTAGGTTGTGGKSATGGTGGHSGAGGTTGSAGDYGFSFRPVQDKQLDYLCTLHAVGPSTYVYVRLDQTGTKSVGIATVPVYTAVLAKISVNGTVGELANAQYDYGGGHHNDNLRFDYQGKSYRYFHSSFGFGYRPCQPMDCVSTYAPGGTTPETDGCTSARTLPEVCVPIKADGTHDPLTDTFKKCAGDSGE